MNAKEPSYTTDPESPHVDELYTEFISSGPLYDGSHVLQEANDTRYCIWPHQSQDGKKHDDKDNDYEAKPWDGASDYRYRLSDTIIDKLVSMLVVAFWSNTPRAEGVEAGDIGEAGALTNLIRWLLRTRMRRSVHEAVELSAQHFAEIGWVALHICWNREVSLQPYDFTMEMVELAARSDPMSWGELPDKIYDPNREDEAMADLAVQFRMFASEQDKGVYEDEIPEVSNKALRVMVRELRKNGTTVVPVPRLIKNEPTVEVLKPYEEFFVHHGARDPQYSTCFVKELLTESSLRNRARDEGWDPSFVEKALETKGQYSIWSEDTIQIGGLDLGWSQDTDDTNLIEIVTAYSRRYDDRGIQGVYYTTFSPHLCVTREDRSSEVYAKHDLLDYKHNRVPIVIGRREIIAKSIHKSRGVPHVVKFDQRIGKVAHDALIDRCTITVLPPVLTYDDTNRVKFGPAHKIKVTQPQRKPEFMQLPGFDNKILDLWMMTSNSAKEQFGVMTDSSDPGEVMAIRQRMIRNYLAMWQQAFTQIGLLCKQYYPPEKYEQITGVPANADYMALDSADETDVYLEFDPMTMDQEMMGTKLKTVMELAKHDATGQIDQGKLMQLMLAKVDPQLSMAVATDQASANEKIVRGVRDEINSMALGNPPMLVEMDPTAGAKLQVAGEILQTNENFARMMQEDQGFNERIQQYLKNLEHSYNQTVVNKERGRKGV